MAMTGTAVSVGFDAGKEWARQNASRLAAALSYYTIFAIAPLLIIVIQIIALVLGAGNASGHHTVARQEIFNSVASSIGPQAATTVTSIVDSTLKQQKAGTFAAIVSWAVLLFAAGGLVLALQNAIDTIFETEPAGGGILGALKARLISFGMLGGIAFLLLVSLVANTVLTALGHQLGTLFPGAGFLIKLADFVVSFAVITALFALIFKVLPQTKVAWKTAFTGGAVTSLLFVIGQFLLGWYLGRASVTSAYGAAGSLIAILLWVYYSAQILLYGAEVTKLLTKRDNPAAATASSPNATQRGTIDSRTPAKA